MVPLFIFDFVDHQCFHEYFIGKKRIFHSFRAEVALLRYIVFYCELGCDTSEPHVSCISRACSSLVRQPYYIPNRFILKIRGLVVVLTVRKVHWAGRAFYIDEYTLIFLFSRCIRCAQKRDCWEPMLMVSDPCGLASTNRTFLPSIASPMPRFSQVVVLPVPPFWLTMAIVVAFLEINFTSPSFGKNGIVSKSLQMTY